MSRRRLWWFAFAIALVVYVSTAHWWGLLHVDTVAATWGGWGIAHGAGNDLSGVSNLPHDQFFLHVDGRLVAGRTAGVVLAGVPLQALLAPAHLSPDTVGVLTACLMTSAAVACLTLLLRGLASSDRQALSWSLIVAFATPWWSVSSAELWTHSADALWLSWLLLSVADRRWTLVGLTGVAAVWTRPHLAAAIAVVVVWCAVAERRWRPALVAGALGCIGVCGLVAWNTWMFGRPSISGAYTGQAQSALHAGSLFTDPRAAIDYVNRLLIFFLSPYRGLFIFTPLAILGVYAAFRRWGDVPTWARAALVGALAYLAVQLQVDSDWTGGSAFFGNRYSVEVILLSAPACFAGYVALLPASPRLRAAARALTAFSLLTFATGVLLASEVMVQFAPRNGWVHSQLIDTVANAPGSNGVVAVGLAAAFAGLAMAIGPVRVLVEARSARPSAPGRTGP